MENYCIPTKNAMTDFMPKNMQVSCFNLSINAQIQDRWALWIDHGKESSIYLPVFILLKE